MAQLRFLPGLVPEMCQEGLNSCFINHHFRASILFCFTSSGQVIGLNPVTRWFRFFGDNFFLFSLRDQNH